jgi:hypothetical protein
MAKPSKTRASQQEYVSPSQGVLPFFEMPFSGSLTPDNRWIILANKLPWDILVNIYKKQMKNSSTGAGGINPRVVIGALIIKHICDLSDRETIQQIRENVYMQYFIGYSGFSSAAPFDPSLFVELRTRLDMEQINAINERIVEFVESKRIASKPDVPVNKLVNPDNGNTNESEKIEDDVTVDPQAPNIIIASVAAEKKVVKSDKKGQKQKDKKTKNRAPSTVSSTHRGKMIIDATVCPQDIAYPTDLNLLNDAREKSEELIDVLYKKELHGKKPRTYRRKARKLYLNEAQKKSSSARAIHKANGKQLNFLKRNIGHIHSLLDKYPRMPLDRKQFKYFLVIQTLHDQQEHMHKNRLKTVEHRIVSIHQPHVRPIIRGKRNSKVEFGSKIQVSLMNDYVFLDDLEWDAFNEGIRLKSSVEKYKKRFGYYPAEVLADKIYCTRENRTILKSLGIKLRAKPLGRPSSCSAVEDHVRPGERNPIEGVFGQGKTAYGMNRIKARLSQTSGSWVASIIMVINLVKITRLVYHTLNCTARTFSTWVMKFLCRRGGRKFSSADHYLAIWPPAAA